MVLTASDVAFHASKITPTHKYANLHEPNGMTKLLILPSNTNGFYTDHEWEEKFCGQALFVHSTVQMYLVTKPWQF